MSVAAHLAGWVLCLMLDFKSTTPAVCLPEPDHETCLRDLREWINHGWAWESRSGLQKSVLALCVPPEMRK